MNIARVLKRDRTFTRIWNSVWVGATLWCSASALLLYWHYELPSPGKAIGAVAVVAGIMSVREIKTIGKVLWVFILILGLAIEFRSIDKDRFETAIEAGRHLREEREGFKNVLDQDLEHSQTILAQQNSNFDATIQDLLTTERHGRSRFYALLAEDARLRKHQEEVAESLRGILTPANEPTPGSVCRTPSPDETLIVYGKGAFLVKSFPFIIIDSRSHGPLLSLDKLPDGRIFLQGDIRGKDQRIIVRLNAQGFVLNHSGFLEINQDKHSLVVVDDYGVELLNLKYLNERAISVGGAAVFVKGFNMEACLSNFRGMVTVN